MTVHRIHFGAEMALRILDPNGYQWALKREVAEWCEEEDIVVVTIDAGIDWMPCWIDFENDEQAVLFRLKWS